MIGSACLICVLFCACVFAYVTGSLKNASPRFLKFSKFLEYQQLQIINELEGFDKTRRFLKEPFERLDGQGNVLACGTTGVIQEGKLIEKGGVSVTLISGRLTKERAAAMSARGRKVRWRQGCTHQKKVLVPSRPEGGYL
mgnify:FL=1